MENKKLVLVASLWMLLAILLSACGNSASTKSNFPTGRFIEPGNDFLGMQFNEDGTWYAINYGSHDPYGTYSVKGDLYIEESNNYNCGKFPMSFRYTFDGTNLKFELTEESKSDTCIERRNAFDGKVLVLSE